MLTYTPKLTEKHSAIVRRIAWGFDIPMTKVMSHFIELSASLINKKQICTNCRDKSFCSNCIFTNRQRSKLPGKKLVLLKGSYYFEDITAKPKKPIIA